MSKFGTLRLVYGDTAYVVKDGTEDKKYGIIATLATFDHVNTTKNVIANCDDCDDIRYVFANVFGKNVTRYANPYSITDSDILAAFGKVVAYNEDLHRMAPDTDDLYSVNGGIVARYDKATSTYYAYDGKRYTFKKASLLALYYGIADTAFNSKGRLRVTQRRSKDGKWHNVFLKPMWVKGTTEVKK